jgi:SulP family sulfate permease
MEDMLLDLEKNKVTVLFVNLLKQPRYMMERIDIIPDFIPKNHIFKSFKDCILWIKENVKEQH